MTNKKVSKDLNFEFHNKINSNIFITIKTSIMKKLFFVFVLFYSKVNGQSSPLIKLDIYVLNKIRVAVEQPLGNHFSYGGSFNFYYGLIPGVKFEPTARFYLGGESPSGLYLQGRFLYGIFRKEFIYYNGDLFNNGLDEITKKATRTSLGGGIDLGFQFLSGRKKNIVVDISLGTQLMKDINHSIIEGGKEYSTANIGFLTTGPGAIFTPRLSVGYRF